MKNYKYSICVVFVTLLVIVSGCSKNDESFDDFSNAVLHFQTNRRQNDGRYLTFKEMDDVTLHDNNENARYKLKLTQIIDDNDFCYETPEGVADFELICLKNIDFFYKINFYRSYESYETEGMMLYLYGILRPNNEEAIQ